MGDVGGGLLISPDGVAPGHMVSVSAFVIFSCTTEVQKIFFWHWLTWIVLEKGPQNGGGGGLTLLTGQQKDIQPVKTCKNLEKLYFASPSSLASIKFRMVYLAKVVLEKEAIK